MFGIGALREEVEKQHEKINNSINDINARISYQSETEIQLKKLENESVNLRREKSEYENNLYELQKTNEKLVDYILNIEEVKEANVKIMNYSNLQYSNMTTFEVEKIIIPPLSIAKIVKKGK